MGSLNKVQIIGTLGRDPELRYSQSGTAFASLSVASSDKWTDKTTGEKREKTEWHQIVIIGKLAEIANQYLKKGSKAYFEGKNQTRKWQDKNTGQDRYITEVVIDMKGEMVMLSSPRGSAENDSHTSSNQPPTQSSSEVTSNSLGEFDPDNFPF